MIEVTKDFRSSKEKHLRVFYNDSLGTFNVENEARTEVMASFYDNLNVDGDASAGTASNAVQKFIDEF